VGKFRYDVCSIGGPVTEQRSFLVDGQWALRTTGDVIDVVSHHSEEVIGTGEPAGPTT
jgi:hypothetical protein